MGTTCRPASWYVIPCLPRHGDVEPRHVDIAIGEIAEDLGAAALEWNVHEIKTGAFGEDFGIDLLIAADAGATVTDLARVFAGVGEKVGERRGGKTRRGREEVVVARKKTGTSASGATISTSRS